MSAPRPDRRGEVVGPFTPLPGGGGPNLWGNGVPPCRHAPRAYFSEGVEPANLYNFKTLFQNI